MACLTIKSHQKHKIRIIIKRAITTDRITEYMIWGKIIRHKTTKFRFTSRSASAIKNCLSKYNLQAISCRKVKSSTTKWYVANQMQGINISSALVYWNSEGGTLVSFPIIQSPIEMTLTYKAQQNLLHNGRTLVLMVFLLS